MVVKIEVYLPDKVYERLKKIEKEQGVKMQDILIRAIVKVIEEFEK